MPCTTQRVERIDRRPSAPPAPPAASSPVAYYSGAVGSGAIAWWQDRHECSRRRLDGSCGCCCHHDRPCALYRAAERWEHEQATGLTGGWGESPSAKARRQAEARGARPCRRSYRTRRLTQQERASYATRIPWNSLHRAGIDQRRGGGCSFIEYKPGTPRHAKFPFGRAWAMTIKNHAGVGFDAVWAKMNEAQRTVFNLYYHENWLVAEIAVERGVSATRIGQIVAACRDKFRKAGLPDPRHVREGRVAQVESSYSWCPLDDGGSAEADITFDDMVDAAAGSNTAG